MRIISLLAGYAAGLAIATKYKKATSKIKKAVDPTKSKLDLFIEEIVDLHKNAFEDIKSTVSTTFEDVEDFDGLKTKLTSLVDTFSDEFETKLADISGNADEKKEKAIDWLETIYTKYKTTLLNAKKKAAEFSGDATENMEDVVTHAEAAIEKKYTSTKKKLEAAVKKVTK